MYFTGTSLYPDGLLADIAAAVVSIPQGKTDPYWDNITSDSPVATNLYKQVFKSRAKVNSPDSRNLFCVIGALATTSAFNSTASISGYAQNTINSNSGLTLGGAQNYVPGTTGVAGTFENLIEQSLFLRAGVLPTNFGIGNVNWHLIVEPTSIVLAIEINGDSNARAVGFFGTVDPLEDHPDGMPIICQSTTQSPTFDRALTAVSGPYNYVNQDYYWCQGSYDPYMDIGYTRKLFLRSVPAYYHDGVNTMNTVPLGVLTNIYTSRFDRSNIRILGTTGFAATVDTGENKYLVVFPYPVASIYTPQSGVGTPLDGFRARKTINITEKDYAIVIKYTP